MTHVAWEGRACSVLPPARTCSMELEHTNWAGCISASAREATVLALDCGHNFGQELRGVKEVPPGSHCSTHDTGICRAWEFGTTSAYPNLCRWCPVRLSARHHSRIEGAGSIWRWRRPGAGLRPCRPSPDCWRPCQACPTSGGGAGSELQRCLLPWEGRDDGTRKVVTRILTSPAIQDCNKDKLSGRRWEENFAKQTSM